MTTKYSITGMTCASCQAHVQTAVSKVKGVTSVQVNLLTNSMLVEGTASEQNIIKAVEKAGYKASLIKEDEIVFKNPETGIYVGRLIGSLICLIVMMYFSVGIMMLGWPLPGFFHNDPSAIAITEMVLSLVILCVNYGFFVSGFKSLIHLHPNMDALVCLGSGAAWIYSFVLTILCGLASRAGDYELAKHYVNGLFFETAAMIPTIITIGEILESVSKGKTTNALKGLIALAPKTAVILKDGVENEVPLNDVKVGDLFVLRAGSSVPVDGKIINGNGSFDESSLTGESIPNDKHEGCDVFSGTVLQSGYAVCEASKVGEDTTLSKIIKMVNDANVGKAPIAKVADKVSYVFIPVIILVAIIVLSAWLIYGSIKGSPDPESSWVAFALARGISVLVIACPCALGLATPVAIMVASGKGAKNGLLFKTAEALEETGKCEYVVFDKTGTITEGKPQVKEYRPFIENKDLLLLASSLEHDSEHPIAKAIVSFGGFDKFKEVEDFQTFSGNGVAGIIDGKSCSIGKISFIKERCVVSKNIEEETGKRSKEGYTYVFLEIDHVLAAMFAISDSIRKDASKAIAQLKKMGLTPIMLTGDSKGIAEKIASEAGIEEVISEVLPNEKESVIRTLQEKGKVIMVGDGINDAPALTRADIGFGISSGTDIAIESADVVLTKQDLTSVPAAIRLSRRTLLNIKENLFWAFFYNSICIPIAAGALYFATGWAMNPIIGAAAMAVSHLFVVLNALRLNLFEVYNDKSDRPYKKKHKGVTKMEKTFKVEGMMCAHCEAHVKESLEKVKGVSLAKADHLNKSVVVSLNKDVKDEKLIQAIEEAGYRVIRD